jgi:2-oxoglutarate ferredoxin oxidoreductase subunit alpha
MDKRARKLATASVEKWSHRFGAGDADVGVIAWGGVAGAAREAVEAAVREGIKAAGYYTVFISPLPEDEMREFIKPVKKIIVPELNHDGQFARLLRERFLVEPVSVALPLGGPFPVSAILDAIRGV